jgi:hypothetical protein
MGKKKLCAVDQPRLSGPMPLDVEFQALHSPMVILDNKTAAMWDAPDSYPPVDPFANPNRVGLLTLARSILGTAR